MLGLQPGCVRFGGIYLEPLLISQIRTMLADRPNPSDIEKMSAIRRYLYDAGPWNNYQIFSYDLNDREGENINEKLISNYIDTRKGNCVSMPILFTIIGQRMGLDVTLSTAPLHMFVKYTDRATGATINIETTSGGYPARDVWIRQQFSMTDLAIQNGVYLKRLSKKESAETMARILAEFYTGKKQYEKAAIISHDLLEYYPADAETMIRVGSCFALLIQKEFVSKYPLRGQVPPEKIKFYRYLDGGNHFYFEKAEELGWRQENREQHEAFLSSVNRAKAALH